MNALRPYQSDAGSGELQMPCVAADEGLHTYCFWALTITVSCIHEMVALNNFGDGDACVLEEETILEPSDDKVMVFEEFSTTGLWMPPYLTLAKILLKFRAQLHQLTPNTIAKLLKYFWGS
jgi:hypothetical protein